MRNQATIKLHAIKGPRIPYPVREAEIRENEYAYLTADGIAVDDGEGILYWVDTIVTTDAGGSRVYDNNAASGNTLSAAYAAKKDDGILRSWDPPKIYKHGIFVDVNNSLVGICYKPLARNLRCTVDAYWIPMAKDLQARVTVRFSDSSRDLVARTIVLKAVSKNLVSRVSVVEETPATTDLVATVNVRQITAKDLVSQVTVYYTPVDKDLVARVTVLVASSKALVCHLYADQTE
ncbi:MAG: hypothetical protein ABIH76_07355 [Candidatus Bathyarchaeota archaeon]